MGFSLKSITKSVSKALNPVNVISNPLPGITGDLVPGVVGTIVPSALTPPAPSFDRKQPAPVPGFIWTPVDGQVWDPKWTAVPDPNYVPPVVEKINEKLPGGDIVNAQAGMLSSLSQGDLSGAKEAFQESDAAIRDEAHNVVDITQDVNQGLIDVALKPATQVAQEILPEEYANKPLQDLTGLNALAASDAGLAIDTRDANSGLLSKEDRVAATRENAEAINTMRTLGALAASTGIPIVSWIGLAANAAANARMREAGLITSKQGIANVGGAALGAYSGMTPSGGVYQQAATGAGRGALAAYGSDGNVLQGAALGAVGGAAGPLGQQIGGPTGSAVSGALGNTAGAYARGERGSGLFEAAAQGAATGAAGNLAGQYGGQGLTRTTTGALGGLFRDGSQGLLEGGLTGALTGYGGQYGGRTGSMIGGLFARELLRDRSDPTVASTVNTTLPGNVLGSGVPSQSQSRMLTGLGFAPGAAYANRGGLFGNAVNPVGLNRSYLMG